MRRCRGCQLEVLNSVLTAMTANSFSSVLMSVAVGRLPLKDVTVLPLRDLATVARRLVACLLCLL